MSRIPYRLRPRHVVPSLALIALLGAGAASLTTESVEEFEGYVPEGYLDPVGIPTKCFGDTRDVVVGQEYTFEECSRSLNEHIYELALPVTKCVKNFTNLPDKTKAALISMTYNIGSGAMCKSSIVQRMNRGDLQGGCKRMAEIYKYATDRKTGKKVALKGLERRRNYESALCLAGLKEGK